MRGDMMEEEEGEDFQLLQGPVLHPRQQGRSNPSDGGMLTRTGSEVSAMVRDRCLPGLYSWPCCIDRYIDGMRPRISRPATAVHPDRYLQEEEPQRKKKKGRKRQAQDALGEEPAASKHRAHNSLQDYNSGPPASSSSTTTQHRPLRPLVLPKSREGKFVLSISRALKQKLWEELYLNSAPSPVPKRKVTEIYMHPIRTLLLSLTVMSRTDTQRLSNCHEVCASSARTL